jgi:hypothetical protein
MEGSSFSLDAFVIPDHETDLEIPQDGRVCVREALDVEGMTEVDQRRALDGTRGAAASGALLPSLARCHADITAALADDATNILDEAVLTTVYSLVK